MNYYTIANYILKIINVVVIYQLFRTNKREEHERIQKAEHERIQKAEHERIQKEEHERIQKEEHERIQKAEHERIQKAEHERIQKAEHERIQKEEQERIQVEQEEKRIQKEKEVNTWVADGKARYKGEWKNGLPNGKGIKHCYKTDSYLEGNFVDGFLHGYGKQTFQQTLEKTVPYYEGEFNRNKYNGKGEYHYGDGDYYKGMWKDSKYHGQGAAYSLRLNRTWVGEYCNDEKVEGNWVKGEI